MNHLERGTKNAFMFPKSRGGQRRRSEGSSFFHERLIASVPPGSRLLRQSPHPGHASGPQALRRSPEGISPLRRDHPDGLEHGLSGITAEYGGMVHPLERRFELRVQRVQSDCVNAGSRSHTAFRRWRRFSFRTFIDRFRAVRAARRTRGFGVGLRNGGKATFPETFQDTSRFLQQMMGAIVLAPGYQRESSR